MVRNYFLLRRMPAYATVPQAYIQRMPNVPLERMSEYTSYILHTLAYVSTIRYSVTGPLQRNKGRGLSKICPFPPLFL